MEQKILMFAVPLTTGYLLDLLLGDPRWLPHPIRFYGQMITFGETYLNKGGKRFLKGAFLCIALCFLTFFFFHIINHILIYYSIYLYYVLSSVFVFFGLANKSLLQEGQEVFKALKIDLEAGRKRLSWIVGRDTSQLNARQIRIAVFETLSENLNDGVIAPLFFYCLGGIPGMMTYKMINTMDSMIGYKNEKYYYFGKFAARLDDMANFIPARITALLMVFVSFSKRSLLFIIKYGNKHSSPNSGYPEAALAGILNCRFGGSNTYHGKLVNKPFIGESEREIHDHEFKKVFYINHAVTFLFIAISILYFICIE